MGETMNSATNFFKNKTILITGGTGSFGKSFARYLLEQDLAAKVIIFSRDEWKQWQMQENDPIFRSPKVRFFLGDVRDGDRLKRAFNDVHFVVHAAALKQVPAAEYNPSEFVKTNVLGAMNIIDAAIDTGVEKVIALSTDKAVNPVNLYGATKLCSDKLLIAANSYVGKRGFPTFSVVRYGNVLGSRGSLLPFWKELLEKGAKKLPITDPRMTRFWITLPQAVQFVVNSMMQAVGGEIFIPKAPSVKITDLATAFRPDIEQEICGIRPGEKIHEILLSDDDGRQSFELADCYVNIPIVSTKAFTHYQEDKNAKRIPEGFVYASNTNPLALTELSEIRSLIAHLSKEG
jgi:UDP-N-acetylglucosamine 4,6-dehydratase/5-epimerase